MKAHPFFEGIDWEKLDNLKYRPPFVPQVSHMFDVRNIDPQFVNEPIPQSVIDDGVLRVAAGETSATTTAVRPQFEVEVTGIVSRAKSTGPTTTATAPGKDRTMKSSVSAKERRRADSFQGFSFSDEWLVDLEHDDDPVLNENVSGQYLER